jgi:hypothetical protein
MMFDLKATTLILLTSSISVAAYGDVENKTLSHTGQVMGVLGVYAEEHQGKLPNKLQDLVPAYLPDDRMLTGVCFLPSQGTVLSSLPRDSAVLVRPWLGTSAVAVARADGSAAVIWPAIRPPTPSQPSWTRIQILLGVSGWAAALAIWVVRRPKPTVA